MSAIVVALVLGGAVYLSRLVAWWPVLSEPEHFHRRDFDDRQHVVWARELVHGARAVRVW